MSLQTFQQYFPNSAVDYCFKLWQDNTFKFKITKKRSTKLGDYSFSSEKGHQITVNQDLNPYAFLITYLHEVAHYRVFSTYKRRKAPHGKEWKNAFKELMLPVMDIFTFPPDVLYALTNYMNNPKASSCADISLMKALKIYNENNTVLMLAELSVGDVFSLSGRTFKKGVKRRTRVLCEEVGTKKRYLISEVAEVEKVID